MNVIIDGTEFDGTHRMDGEQIVLRTQSQGDKAGLLKLCPHDQSVPCRLRWSDDGVCLVIEKVEPAAPPAPAPGNAESASAAAAEERARLMAMNDADLQTYAAERNVEWDAKASKQTMVGRIVKATGKK